MFDMINIFEVFLPQLLRYPNPTDPLNGEAAALLMREPRGYDARVKGKDSSLLPSTYSLTIADYVKQYATNIHEQNDEEDKDEDSELSEVEDYHTDGEDEPAGAMDDV